MLSSIPLQCSLRAREVDIRSARVRLLALQRPIERAEAGVVLSGARGELSRRAFGKEPIWCQCCVGIVGVLGMLVLSSACSDYNMMPEY